MTIQQAEPASFLERVNYLEGENQRLSSHGSANVFFVQNMASTLDFFNVDLSNILQEACLLPVCSNQGSNSKEPVIVAIEKKYKFKTLDYFALHNALMKLLSKVFKISSKYDDITKSLLDTLCFTLAFLDENNRIDVPAQVAGLLYQLEDATSEMQEYFMKTFCKTIIPVSFGIVADKSLRDLDDIPHIIMLILECIRDVALHFRLIETLMLFKENLWIDIMSVISLSEGITRVYATQLLFHYWPHLHCTSSKQHKLPSHLAYDPSYCENSRCQSPFSMRTATTMVLDATYPAKIADKPAPLYLCNACTQTSLDNEKHLDYVDVVLPAEFITYYCENKHCLAKNSVATVTLLGSKSSFTGGGEKYVSQAKKHNFAWNFHNRIMRYCFECYHNLQHVIGSLNLTAQIAPLSAWKLDDHQRTKVIVDAVVCLLTEDVNFTGDMRATNNAHRKHGVYPCDGCTENVGLQSESKTLTHFGIWLLVSLCPPQDGIDQELASQLIAAVLVWYKNQSRLSSDDHGNRLQDLKSSLLWQWLKDMQTHYFKFFLNCLLPNPPSEARVKGNWDAIHPLLYQYKNGLDFLSILAPYSIINFELWDCLIPCWMVALSENLESDDLKELEQVLNILFDVDLSPFDFESHDIFNFVLRNFKEMELIYHENALEWLQMLSEIHVIIPVLKLINMLCISSTTMQSYLSALHNHAADTDEENDELSHHYRLPGLTEQESWRVMERSRYPGVDSLTDILEAMYTSTTDSCEDSSRDKLHLGSNEHKKSIIRSGSMRASKRIKAAFLKPKRSLTRRHSPRPYDDVTEPDVSSPPVVFHTPPTPTIRITKAEAPFARKLDSEWKYARIVCCYVDFLDIILRQLQLQDHEQHKGLNAEQSIPILNLLCTLLWNIVENNEERSLPKDDWPQHVKAEIEFTADFCDLASKLLAFLVPFESKKKNDSKTDQPEKKSPSPVEWAYFVKPVRLSMDLHMWDEQDPASSDQCLNLLHLFVKVLDVYANNKAISYHIIKCISLLCIRGKIFNEATVENIDKELDFRMVISSFWRQLDIQYSDTSRLVVAVLFQVIDSIENSWVYQFQLLNAAFVGSQFFSSCDKSIDCWNKEIETLDRIHALLMCLSDLKEKHLQERTPVSHVVTYALAVLLSAFGSKQLAVHIKAKFIIDSLSTENLQAAYQCLQFEFDSSLKDRTFILSQYLLLHQLRPKDSPLSFACFSHIMDVMSNEAKACLELVPIMPFAQLVKQNLPMAKTPLYFRTSNSITFVEWLQMADLIIDIDSDFSDKKPTVNDKPVLHEFNCDSIDIECESYLPKNDFLDDKYVVDLLMRVMCRYMVECLQDEKQLHSRSHNFFQYFRNWIGFHEKFGLISKTGTLLRNAVGVNTLLKNLPNIMDANLALGFFLLPKVVAFLTVMVKISEDTSIQLPEIGSSDFDLGILSPSDQIAWLKTLQVIMYKYTFNGDVELEQFGCLLNVCLNVLLCEYHCCGSNDFEIDFSDGEKSKKNEKVLGSVSTKRRALDKIGKHLVFNVNPTNFNDSMDHDKDEASRPLLSRQPSSNRQDIALELSDDVTMTREIPGETRPSLSAFARGRSDTAGQTVADHVSKIRSLKDGESLENSGNDTVLTEINCRRCKLPLKEYNVETISLSIANLCQFVRFSPTSSVNILPQLLSQLALIAEPLCEEQGIESLHFSNTSSDVMLVAKQSIRCILHQLAESRIFSCIFYIPFTRESSFLRVLIACLRDYHQFHCVGVLKHTLEDLPEQLKLSNEQLFSLLSNMSAYLQYLQGEPTHCSSWQNLANLFATFFNMLHAYISGENVAIGIDVVLMLMINLLKAPILGNTKCVLLEPFSKILTTCISKYNFSSELLYELCEVSYDKFLKDKEKLHLPRCLVSKLVGVLKMHTSVPVQNLLHLLQVVLLDAGSRVNAMSVSEQLSADVVVEDHCYAMDCMKNHVCDCLEILGDNKFLGNLNNSIGSKAGPNATGLNPIEEAYQMNIKLAVAQVVAGQLHKHYSSSHQLQSLTQPPPKIQQRGLKEQSECLNQIKKLSWILLGTLSHLGLQQGACDNLWYPIPFKKSPEIAKIVQALLSGFVSMGSAKENNSTSCNLTTLFHAFLFCQLWTVYCEQYSYFTTFSVVPIRFTNYSTVGDHEGAGKLLFEFWSKVTPGILLLLQERKDPQVLASVHRHIESLMACLQEYNSSVLNKLAPLWSPILNVDLMENANSSRNYEFSLRDPPSPSIVSDYEYDLSGKLDCGAGGLIQNSAKVNANRVLTIVERINRNLVNAEKNELCVL